MRSWLIALIAILTLAWTGAGQIAPSTCPDPCVVDAHSFAYVSPVVVLESGQSLRWSNLDEPLHLHLESAVQGIPEPCFLVSSNGEEDSPPVRFEVTEAGLFATQLGPGGPGEPARCHQAVPLADGAGYALKYHCGLHSQMHGAIVVLSA